MTYLVIDIHDPSFNYIVSDLVAFISEMYEVELDRGMDLETVKGYFFEGHKVFTSQSMIEELN